MIPGDIPDNSPRILELILGSPCFCIFERILMYIGSLCITISGTLLNKTAG